MAETIVLALSRPETTSAVTRGAGRLMADLLGAGWVLEIERACDFTILPSGPETVMDGIQGWRNPRLVTL